MKVTHTPFNNLIIIEPQIFKDERGHFLECFQANRYAKLGLPHFVQDNISLSKRHVLRGLHYQLNHPQGKLIWVTKGHIFDVVIDIRLNSPTFGQAFSIELNDQTSIQLYVPPGFAHGFYVLSKEAYVYYKCTEFYIPQDEYGIIWSDTQLNITWPSKQPILSAKDKTLSPLHEIPHAHLFA